MRNDIISLDKYTYFNFSLTPLPLGYIFLGFKINLGKIQQKGEKLLQYILSFDQTVTKKLIVYKARI